MMRAALQMLLPLFVLCRATPSLAAGEAKTVPREVDAWRVRVVEKPRFAWIEPFRMGHAALNEGGRCAGPGKCEGGKWGYWSAAGRLALAARYDAPGIAFEEGVVVKLEGRSGFVAWDGRVVLPHRFGALVRYENGFFGGGDGLSAPVEVFDPAGRPLFRVPGEVAAHQPALFWASRHGRWGAFDLTGRQVVPFRFAEVSDPGNGLVAVRSGNNWALADGAGRLVTPLMDRVYDTAPDDVLAFNQGGRCDGFLYGCEGGRWGAVNRAGKVVVPPVHDCVRVYDFREDGTELVVVDHPTMPVSTSDDRCSGGTWRLLRRDGTAFSPEGFSFVEAFWGNDYARCARGGACDEEENCTGAKWGLMDREGRFVTPHVYDWLDEYDSIPMAFVRDGKWGFLGEKGVEVVPPRYEQLHVDDDVVRFREGGKWGLMDVAGKVLVPPRHELILPFVAGRARFREGGKWGLLDARGTVIARAVYPVICAHRKGTWRFSRTAGCGLKQGKELLERELVLPGGRLVREGTADPDCACDGAKLGLLDARGREVLPGKYAAVVVTEAAPVVRAPAASPPTPAPADAGDVPPGAVWVLVNMGGKCNRAGLCQGGAWGLADLAGRLLVRPSNAFLSPQEGGWLRVAAGGACDVIDARVEACSPETRWGLSRLEPASK